jgi:hypothetical protein
MIASLAEGAAQKQGPMRSAAAENHGYALAAAQHLAAGGDVERLLGSLCPEALDERDVQGFLDEQRRRLRAVAERNAENEIAVRSFVGACQQLKQDALQYRPGSGGEDDGAPPEGGGDNGGMPEDFVPVIQDLMKKQGELLANDREDAVHKLVREIKVQLGEEKERLLAGGEGDDDEIELVNAGGTAGAAGAMTQGGSLKCPLTCTFSSRQGRRGFLAARRQPCPSLSP